MVEKLREVWTKIKNIWNSNSGAQTSSTGEKTVIENGKSLHHLFQRGGLVWRKKIQPLCVQVSGLIIPNGQIQWWRAKGVGKILVRTKWQVVTYWPATSMPRWASPPHHPRQTPGDLACKQQSLSIVKNAVPPKKENNKREIATWINKWIGIKMMRIAEH